MRQTVEQRMEVFTKAKRFRDTYGYGPSSAYVHTDAVYGTQKPAVQVWFQLDVSDFEKARRFLDLLAVEIAQGGEEGLVMPTVVKQEAQ